MSQDHFGGVSEGVKAQAFLHEQILGAITFEFHILNL
jgi:hypothetical protein